MDRREEIARSLSGSLARPAVTNRQIGSASLGPEEAFRRLALRRGRFPSSRGTVALAAEAAKLASYSLMMSSVTSRVVLAHATGAWGELTSITRW